MSFSEECRTTKNKPSFIFQGISFEQEIPLEESQAEESRRHPVLIYGTANLRTKILDFRGFDSNIILILNGWNSQAHREIPGEF